MKKTKTSNSIDIRSRIEQQLEAALIEWKEILGEKKFRRRIRKAGKMFGKKLKSGTAKKVAKTKIVDVANAG